MGIKEYGEDFLGQSAKVVLKPQNYREGYVGAVVIGYKERSNKILIGHPTKAGVFSWNYGQIEPSETILDKDFKSYYGFHVDEIKSYDEVKALVAVQAPVEEEEVVPQATGLKDLFSQQLDENKRNLLLAGQIQGGGIALDNVRKGFAKFMPKPFKKFFKKRQNRAAFDFILANGISAIIKAADIDNPQIDAVSKAMLTASTVDGVAMLEIRQTVSQLTDQVTRGVNMSNLLPRKKKK